MRRLCLAWLLCAALEGCAQFSPQASPAMIKTLQRETYVVPALGDVQVSYLRAGDPSGRRVIFVHGTPGQATGWSDFLLHVPAGFEYVAIDRPGFGRTFPGHSDPSIDRQAQALEPLLVERHGHWPVLVGHSYGGPVIAAAAASHPDHVAGLVLVSAALDPAQEHVLLIQRIAQHPPVLWLLPRSLRNTNEELIPLKGQLQALASRLPDVTPPIVIIHGDRDPLVPYANVAYMRAHFTGSSEVEVVTLAGRNHFLPWNSRDVIEAALAKMTSP